MTASKVFHALPIWAALAALGFVLPDHRLPWTAFHAEWWVSAAMLLLAVRFFLNCTRESSIALPMAKGIWVLLPLGVVVWQWGVGLIVSTGTAWMAVLYLAALAYAVFLGSCWQAGADGEVLEYVAWLFMFAGAVSVGLQLYQLFGGEWAGHWINDSVPYRFDANLAQPNNMATLLVLSALGLTWLYERKHLVGWLAGLLGGGMLLGVMLTGSRTGILQVCLVAIAFLWGGQHLVVVARWRSSVALLACWFVLLLWVAVPLLETVAAHPLNDGVAPAVRSVVADARIEIWRIAVNAMSSKPLLGYGWGQIPSAQISVLDGTAETGLFNSSHNIFLDIALWGGIPLAITFAVVLLLAAWQALHSLKNVREWVTLTWLAIMGTHAMVELPLHYAYFLWPTGLLLGSLLPARDSESNVGGSRWVGIAGGVLLVLGLIVTGRDYLRVEAAQTILRLESVGAASSATDSERMPKLHVLKQYEDFFELSRITPQKGYSTEQLLAMENAVLTTPSEDLMYRMAAQWALHGQLNRARTWMKYLCFTKTPMSCRQAKINWASQGYDRKTGLAWLTDAGV